VAEPYLHRVLYGDTDQMQVVYYGAYLRFFEGARNEWIRSHGVTYVQIEEAGVFLPVVEAGAKYHRPARYDDLLEIVTEVSATRVRIRFDYRVRRQGETEPLTSGFTVHACVSRAGKPQRMPDWLVEKLQPHLVKGISHTV
jgi:acyl-CoA thioester hydrolase